MELIFFIIIFLIFGTATKAYTRNESNWYHDIPEYTPTQEEFSVEASLGGTGAQTKEPVSALSNTNYRHSSGNMYASREEKQVYMRSAKWQQLRADVIARDKVCVVCGSKGTEVHHLHYDNLLDEDLIGLVLLCRSCHQDQHDEYGYDRKTDYTILVNKTSNPQ